MKTQTTPKTKAQELIAKFIRYTPAQEKFEYEYAVRCSILCVEEMLYYAESNTFHGSKSAKDKEPLLSDKDYLWQVHKELCYLLGIISN